MGVEHKEVPVLRLQDVSPRRLRAYSLSFKCEKGDPLGTGATPPFLSAPSSPKFLRMLEDGDSAVTENLLPSCRLEGAVPFKWEEKPGTPKSPQVTDLRLWSSSSPEFEQGRVAVDSPRSASKELFCSSVGSLSPLPEFAEAQDQAVEEPQADFEFSSSRFEAEVCGGGGRAGGWGATPPPPAVAADELFFQGHLLPLKPPPRLQSQLTASRHWRSATCESFPVTEGGDGSDGSPQSVDSSQSPSCAPTRSLGQAVGLTTVRGRGGSRSASAAKKLLAFCGLSNKGVRRSVAVGRDEARLSTSDVYLMSGQEIGGSTEARLSSAKDSGDLYGSFSSQGEERRRDRSRGRSVDFTGHSRSEESNFASADCSLPAGSGTRASLPATPTHRKGKSYCQKDKSGGFLSGFRSGKEEEGSRQTKKLFKEEEGAVDSGDDNGAAHRRVRSLSPLSVFKRAERTKRGVSVDEKDGSGISFDGQISWSFDEKERDNIDARPNAGVPKKLLGNSSKAWSGLRGLTLTELLEDPRDVVASSRQTDSPGSNSSSGSFGTGSGSFGSMTSSNSGSNSSGAAESVDSGSLPYYPQDVKPGRHSNASASPGLKKALLAKSQGSPPDSSCTSDALGSDHFPLYRRYKSQPGKEDPLGRIKSLWPNKGGIFSCLGCYTVKSYDAFQGVPNMRVA